MLNQSNYNSNARYYQDQNDSTAHDKTGNTFENQNLKTLGSSNNISA